MEATIVWDDDTTGQFIVSDVSAGPRAYPPAFGGERACNSHMACKNRSLLSSQNLL